MDRRLLAVSALLTLATGCGGNGFTEAPKRPEGTWVFGSGAAPFGSLGPASHPSSVAYLTLYEGGAATIVMSDDAGIKSCPEASFTEDHGKLTLSAARLGGSRTFTWSRESDPATGLDELVLDDGAGNVSRFIPATGVPEEMSCEPYQSLGEGQLDSVEGDGVLIADGIGLWYAIGNGGTRRLGQIDPVSMAYVGVVHPSVADVTYTGPGDGSLYGNCGGALCRMAADGSIVTTLTMTDLGVSGTLDGASFALSDLIVSTRMPDGTATLNSFGGSGNTVVGIAIHAPIHSISYDGLHVWALSEGLDSPVAIAIDPASQRIVRTIELPKPASGDYGALAYFGSRLFLIQRPAGSASATLIQIAAP